jgi:hypothetical protein
MFVILFDQLRGSKVEEGVAVKKPKPDTIKTGKNHETHGCLYLYQP